MDKVLKVNDTMFVVMTVDRKCILRGRKNTRLLLSLVDEKNNHKLFTCRHAKEVLDNLNSNRYTIWLTEEVRKLYGIKGNSYKNDKMPKLVEVRANLEYRINI